MQILSIWVMAILLMHLDKKLALSSEALEATNEKMKSLEDSAVIFRQRQRQQLNDIGSKLGRLLNKAKSSSSTTPTTRLTIESDHWDWK